MLRSTRALPAAILAAVVLLVAMAGGATAAKLITGKQIKNGTVTTLDLKNNNITGSDLKNGSVSAADLAAGAKSSVRTTEGPDQNIATCNDTGLGDCTPVVATPLTAGTWLVTATVTISNFSGGAPDHTNRCGLYGVNEVLAEAHTPLGSDGNPGEGESIAFTQVITTPGASNVSIRCSEMPGESLRAGSPTITALKVS